MTTALDVHWTGAFAITVAACWFDVRTRRIPNSLTFPAAALGLVAASVAHGGQGMAASAAGLLVGLAMFFPLFLLKGLGAGDVKLMGALGAWLGTSVMLGVAFYTSLAGGILALVLIAKHRYGRQAARNLWLLLTHWRVFGLSPVDALTLETSAGPKLPYALPIAAGVVLTRCLW
ncbi:MAG TPA: A24 family peptidase [Vicinamibacterales bacterium]|nr:A24 family peptidase [Vicinamibacterales bacterium]